MKTEFRGFSKVFSFTLKNQMKLKSYLSTTIVIGLICFLIPFSILMYKANTYGNEGSTEEIVEEIENTDGMEIDVPELDKIKDICIIDNTEDKPAIETLDNFLIEKIGHKIQVKNIGRDIKSALKSKEIGNNSLILLIEQIGMQYNFKTLLPDNSNLNYETADEVANFVEEYASSWAEAENLKNQGEASEEKSFADFMVGAAAYINIMLLYFFALMYGQSVAGSIVLEKNSKLMEMILVSVKPFALIFGKILAIVLASMIQLSVWIGSIAVGILAGSLGGKLINPDANKFLGTVWEILTTVFREYVSPTGLIIGFVITISGVLLYCTLSSIGGAFASKQEDLASTNIIFVWVIIACFLICMAGGGLDGATPENGWMDFVPFIAVMVTPAKLIMGNIPIWKGIVSLGILWAAIIALVFVAGKVYKATVLYKGKVFSPKAIIKLFRK